MKKEEIDILVQTLQSLQDPELPPPPPPEPEKPIIASHPYITINGKEPEEHKDFLSTDKGKAIVTGGIAITVAFFLFWFALI